MRLSFETIMAFSTRGTGIHYHPMKLRKHIHFEIYPGLVMKNSSSVYVQVVMPVKYMGILMIIFG